MLGDHILYYHDFTDRECVDITKEKFDADHFRSVKGSIGHQSHPRCFAMCMVDFGMLEGESSNINHTMFILVL